MHNLLAVQGYISFLKNKNLKNNTIDIYVKNVLIFLKYKTIENTFFEKKKWSNQTKRVFVSAVKAYKEYKNEAGFSSIKIPKKTTKKQDWISFEEYQRLLLFLSSKKKTQIKTRIVLQLLYETGVRSSELLGICRKDILGSRILINGKGEKQRYVWVSDSLVFNILEYSKNISNDCHIFNFGYKNLYKKIRGLGKHINKKLTPHMFRRGFATYCMKKNVDIYSLSQMMGHSDINTTKLYIYDFDLKSKMENLFQ